MKVAESKTSTTAQQVQTSRQAEQPFFQRQLEGGQSAFFGQQSAEQSTPFFQPKLKIGAPNDHYEQQADAVADRVVAKLNDTSSKGQEASNKGQSANSDVQHSSTVKTASVAPATVQTKCATCEAEEKKPQEDIQMLTSGEMQRKPIFDSAADPSEDAVQMKSEGGNTEGSASSSFESQLASTKGGGSALPLETQQQMGSAIGADFSGVRVHSDSNAAKLSDSIGAQAFAHGNDVYFNEGKYSPSTTEGSRLLAHELTHTVQQGAAVRKKDKIVQRATKKTGKGITDLDDVKTKIDDQAGTELDPVSKELTMPLISLPPFKSRNAQKFKKPLYATLKTSRGIAGGTKQHEIWPAKVRSSAPLEEALNKLLDGKGVDEGGVKYYYFKLRNSDYLLFGTKEDIKASESYHKPNWDRQGNFSYLHIDHIVEYQIGGQDAFDNYELLQGKANISSGSSLMHERTRRRKKALEALDIDYTKKVQSQLDNHYIFKFTDYDWNLGVKKGDGDAYWSSDEILKGAHLNHLIPLTPAEISALNKDKSQLLILSNGGIFKPKRINKKNPDPDTFRGFTTTLTIINEDAAVGQTVANLSLKPKTNKKVKANKPSIELPLTKASGALNACFINMNSLSEQVKRMFSFTLLSPIEFEQVTLTDGDGLAAEGIIKTDFPFFKEKTELSISMIGDKLAISKNFSPADINFPKPFTVTGCGLSIFMKGQDLGAEGTVDFEIEKLGNGQITGGYDTAVGIYFSGEFNFNSKWFSPALVGVKYNKKDGFSINADIGLKEGTIKGVKDANLKVLYAKDVFSVKGAAHLSIPGIDEIRLTAQFDDKGNFAFTAGVDLKQMKGIKSGKVTVTVTSKEGDDIKLRVEGKASPDLPKVPKLTSELDVLYDNGIFKVSGTVRYQEGRFDGTITAGVTNQQVDDKGNPQGAPNEAGEVFIFGFGSLTVDLYKNKVKGTVSVRVTPEKEVFIGGKIEANNLKPFGEGYHPAPKELLKFPTIEIPLIGIPGLSISAFVGGGVFFKFSWDPLVLKQLSVEFKETNINELDKAQFEIKGSVGSIATAEVYMAIEAGIKGRALIAVLTGKLGGEAGLGVTAEAGGDIAATMDLQKGLQLKEIGAHLDVTPKAMFRLTGGISVDLDLWVTSVNLYEKKWVLAEQQIDMGALTLKAGFQIKFDEEGNVIPPDLDKIDLEKPNFDGDAGKAVLDKGINGDAEKELEAKKQEIRDTVKHDLRDSTDPDFSPSTYTKKMKKKYAKSPELQEFVVKTIEEESRLIEYEEFDKLKNRVKELNIPLANKMTIVSLFGMFFQYVTEGDVASFKAELVRLDEERKLKEAQEKEAAAQAAEQAKREQLAQQEAQKQEAAKARRKGKKPKKGGKSKNAKV